MKALNMLRLCALLVAATLLGAPASGAQTAPASETEREIEDHLIAPCCWTQPVSQHYSEAADTIRKEVHEMVAAGKSRDAIMNYYVSKYGERILITPRPKGFNALVYILPWLALILGAWLLILLLKRLRSPVAPPAPEPLPDPRYASIIEKELKEMQE